MCRCGLRLSVSKTGRIIPEEVFRVSLSAPSSRLRKELHFPLTSISTPSTPWSLLLQGCSGSLGTSIDLNAVSSYSLKGMELPCFLLQVAKVNCRCFQGKAKVKDYKCDSRFLARVHLTILHSKGFGSA